MTVPCLGERGARRLPVWPVAAVLTLAWAGALLGEDAAPAKPDDPKPKAADAKAAPEKPQDVTPQTRITIALGQMSQDVNGNRRRFWQYNTPPTGTHIALLGAVHPLDQHGLAFEAYGYDLFQPGVGATGRLYDVDAGVRVDTRYRRSRFFRDFDPAADPLRRDDWETDVRWRASTHNYVRGYYLTLSERGGDTTDPVDNSEDRRAGVSYHRAVGAFDASTAWDYEHFDFPVAGTAPFYSGTRNLWTLGVSRGRSSNTLLSGSLGTATTDLPGAPSTPRELIGRLDASHAIASNLTVNADFGMWQLTNAVTQNTYAKNDRRAAFETEWSGLPKTVVRASVDHADVDYVNGDHSAVDKPSLTTFRAAFRSRPWRFLKLDGDYRTARDNGRPIAIPVGGLMRPTLVWAQSDRLRFRANFTPRHAQYGLTTGWMADERRNPDRATNNQIITRDATAWWAVTSKVTTTASFTNQSFGLRGIGATGDFVSDSQNWILGATWQADHHTSLNTAFARSASTGSLPLNQETWTLSFEHSMKDQRVRLGVTLDNLADHTGSALGYDANLWYAEFSSSFR